MGGTGPTWNRTPGLAFVRCSPQFLSLSPWHFYTWKEDTNDLFPFDGFFPVRNRIGQDQTRSLARSAQLSPLLLLLIITADETPLKPEKGK